MHPHPHPPSIPGLPRASAFLKPASRRIARILTIAIWCVAVQPLVHPVKSSAQTPAAAASDEAGLLLETLEDFHSVEQQTAKKAVTDLDAGYRKDLEKIQKDRQDAGNLNGVISAKLALEDLDAGLPRLTGNDPELSKIQQPYLARRKTALAECAGAVAKVDKDFAASLADEVGKLTKAGKIEQAVKVQKRLDEFTASLKSGTSGGAGKPAAKSEEVEAWKKKAIEEFPALADPKSPLSLKVRDRVKELNNLNPSYFQNPQWPLLLAREVSEKKAAAPTIRARIPTAAKSFNGKKYHVYTEPCSWHAAREKCEAVGGQLVVIKDDATESFVEKLAEGRELWLGATDEVEEGKWIWVDGTDMKFKSFKPGQPDNEKGTNHYLALVQWLNDPDWNDGNDNGPIAGYICEWPDRP